MSEYAASAPIRIAILDDHQVLSEALKLTILAQPDLSVVGTAATCAAGLAMVQETQPDVLLLDVMLPDGDGIRLVPQIKSLSPGTNILVLTSLSDEATLRRALDAGVTGFVPKSSGLSELGQSIHKAAAGEITVPGSLLMALLHLVPTEAGEKSRTTEADPLTSREKEILSLLAQGKSGAEIAKELVIAPMTVRTHIRNLMEKLGVRSRLEAVTCALRLGLIEPPL